MSHIRDIPIKQIEQETMMAAMWKAKVAYNDTPGLVEYLYFYAADAKSMKRKDISAAARNAKLRAKQRFARKGRSVRVLEVNCVG
jgi:hypothetical protein